MKYFIILLLSIGICLEAYAQTQTTGTTATTTTTKKKTTQKKKTTTKPAAPPKDITFTIKSLCEKPVPIYAGAREGLKKPKIQTLGGMSTNTLHVKSSDVVCIMSSDGKKTVACTNLKTTTKELEVNNSGTEVKSK